MTMFYLGRAQLRRDAPAAALARLLVPEDGSARVAAGHHLIWSLFSDGADRRRDFLWREERPGRFITLSARPPADPHGLFDLDEAKPFEPDLLPGDRLEFSLRANPVIARSPGPGQRGKRHDVVMDALHKLPSGGRAEQRLAAIATAGLAWLERQGVAHGFALMAEPRIDGYETVRLPRPTAASVPLRSRRHAPMLQFGQLDFDGLLTVQEPGRFLAAVCSGLGRARAFGCGLILIRRARPG